MPEKIKRSGQGENGQHGHGGAGEDHPSGLCSRYQRVYEVPDINYQGVQYCSSMQAADILQQRAVTTK